MVENQERLLVIANRLPVTLMPLDNGEYDFQSSSGGLAAGLKGLRGKVKFKWFGWPGLEVPRKDIKMLEAKLASDHHAVPVWLSKTLATYHYDGFSNQILWPILHGFKNKMIPDKTATVAYEAVNRLFAKEIALHVRDDDYVWIHDYHLMLLPLFLREELGDTKSNVKIGFFLHTPFPDSTIWSVMPLKDQILRGILGSNLVGFHTQDYANKFRRCCMDVLDIDVTENIIRMDNRFVDIAAFPIGIQPEDFDDLLSRREVQDIISTLEQQVRGIKVIVGVDRLDYIKGIPEKLRAFDRFMSDFPGRKERVKLIQVAIPSRESCPEYAKLVHEVNSLVSEINGKHSSITFTPIRFIHHSICKEELAALYAISDICLITSIRDGMNLVSYEYVACQQDRGGVLIISQHAGAADTLRGSLPVDPINTDEIAQTIERALHMDYDERKQKQQTSLETVRRQTSASWGASFLKHLREAK